MQTGLGLSLRQTRGFVWTSYRRRPLAWISYRRGAICLRDLQLANRRKGRWASGLNFIQTPLGVSKGSWAELKTDERRLGLDELQDWGCPTCSSSTCLDEVKRATVCRRGRRVHRAVLDEGKDLLGCSSYRMSTALK